MLLHETLADPHPDDIFCSPAFFTFSPQKALFRHSRFSALFLAMKVAESRKIVFVRFVIDFKDIQV
jgi:hypothetical protein